MAPMHTNLAGLKALFCDLGYNGIKTIRECCGAMGFSKYSGIAWCISTASPLVTLEGDAVVMNLQTARALLKSARQVLMKGKKVDTRLAYINDLKNLDKFVVPTDFTNLQTLLGILKQNALQNIANCSELFASEKYRG